MGEPLAVMVNGVPPVFAMLLSIKRFDWQVSKETVPALTVVVRAVVGTAYVGVVYNAPPLVIRALLI